MCLSTSSAHHVNAGMALCEDRYRALDYVVMMVTAALNLDCSPNPYRYEHHVASEA
jgi:hypothetical protein